jgi:hypothetical protein
LPYYVKSKDKRFDSRDFKMRRGVWRKPEEKTAVPLMN